MSDAQVNKGKKNHEYERYIEKEFTWRSERDIPVSSKQGDKILWGRATHICDRDM
tara:strand:+ start:797 stop:961 length:165 start_codon:yes stop_codon:yes gene_type:complete